MNDKVLEPVESPPSEDPKKSFDLRSFAEMKEPHGPGTCSMHHENGHDLLDNHVDRDTSQKLPDPFLCPQNVTVSDVDMRLRVRDDMAIKRLTMGALEKNPFVQDQESWRTTPRRPPNEKYYLCPSNTIVATNGDVYHVEPFMLPPPDQISSMMRELQTHRDQRGSLGGPGWVTPVRGPSSPSSGARKGMTPLLRDAKDNDAKHARVVSPARTQLSNSIFEHDSHADEKQSKLMSTSVNTQNMPPSYENWVKLGPSHQQRTVGNKEPTPKNSQGNQNGSGCASRYASTSVKIDPVHHHEKDLRQRKGRGSGGGSQGGSATKISLSAIATPYANIKNVMQASKEEGDFDEQFDSSQFSILKYLKMEMFGIGEPCKGDAMEANKTIENFLSVPMGIERVVVFGFLICVDAYLYVFTFLPVRVAFSFMLLAWDWNAYAYQKLKKNTPWIDALGLGDLGTHVKGGMFQRANAYDILRAMLLILGAYALSFLHMSRVYHYIRQQTTIKLYALTGMMEIFDKLLGSFGQDAFDALYSQTRTKNLSYKLAISFVVALLYVILHSAVYFVTIATLTVAINSAEQALITVLILNNFAEIKSFVFKKFDRLMLFQLACKDITERFQIVLFLLLIMVVSLVQAGSGWMETMPSYFMVIFYMWLSEMLADWMKHAFLTKFNVIDANIYTDMLRVLRKDVLKAHKDQAIVDHTYTIARRVGLSQIALACVSVRYLWLALDSPMYYYQRHKVPLKIVAMHITTAYLVLLGVQTAIGVGLIFYCGGIHNKEVALTKIENKISSPITKEDAAKKKAQRESIEKLSNIERYTAYKGRIVG